MSSPTPNTPNPPGTPNTVNDRMVAALNRLPRIGPILGVLVCLIVGAVVPTYGWIFTALVALFLVWMFVLSQARLTGVEKLMRIAVIVFITAIAIIQSRPRG